MTYDLEEDEEPQEPKSARKSAEPMPRLWKSETEPAEEESRPTRKTTKNRESEPARKSTDSKQPPASPKSRSGKAKEAASADEKGEKKVLIEETPTFDTYEARRRARLIMGGLIVASVFLFGWTIYRVFLYDPCRDHRRPLPPSRPRISPAPKPPCRSTRKPASCTTGHKSSPKAAGPTRPWRC